MYLIVDETSKECAVVDPVDPERVTNKCKELNVKVTKILTTHHHWDHAGGNQQLLNSLPEKVPVYGGDDQIQALTKKVGHNDTIKIGNLNVTCLHTPCHTRGHICYFVTDTASPQQTPAVFTGDTLFLAGCGRFFEGNATEMHRALIEILAKLPESTFVYCGHEYSVSNLKYSVFVEPENKTAKAKLAWAEEQRAKGLPTIPSTIKEELAYNPFMRVGLQNIMARYGTSDGISTMTAMRKEKDTWRPSK